MSTSPPSTICWASPRAPATRRCGDTQPGGQRRRGPPHVGCAAVFARARVGGSALLCAAGTRAAQADPTGLASQCKPPSQVRAAYRKAAAKAHPDVDPSPNASNKFKVGGSWHKFTAAWQRICAQCAAASPACAYSSKPRAWAAARLPCSTQLTHTHTPAYARRVAWHMQLCTHHTTHNSHHTPIRPSQAISLALEVLADESLRSLCAARGLDALGAKYSFLVRALGVSYCTRRCSKSGVLDL